MSDSREGTRAPRTGTDDEHLRGLRALEKYGFGPLAPIGQHRVYEDMANVFTQGKQANRFCIVSWGRLKVCFQTHDGRSLTLGLVGPGQVVGFASALGGRLRRTCVVALQETGCLILLRDRFLEFLSKEPHLLGDLLPLLTRNLVGCTNCLAESGCTRVETRIARVFKSLLRDPEVGVQETGQISLRLSRRELADLAGTTVESCSRVMSTWRRKQILVTSDEGFLIKDLSAIQRLGQ